MSSESAFEALERMIATGASDVGTLLWQAASAGSVETLEMIMKLPMVSQ